MSYYCYFFFFQVEDGIRGGHVTGVQTCALPILPAELLGAVLLAVAPLPQDRPEELGGYARGVLIARSEERRVGKECYKRGSELMDKRSYNGSDDGDSTE